MATPRRLSFAREEEDRLFSDLVNQTQQQREVIYTAIHEVLSEIRESLPDIAVQEVDLSQVVGERSQLESVEPPPEEVETDPDPTVENTHSHNADQPPSGSTVSYVTPHGASHFSKVSSNTTTTTRPSFFNTFRIWSTGSSLDSMARSNGIYFAFYKIIA